MEGLKALQVAGNGRERLRRTIINGVTGKGYMRLPGRGRPTVSFTTCVTAPVNDNPRIAVRGNIFIS